MRAPCEEGTASMDRERTPRTPPSCARRKSAWQDKARKRPPGARKRADGQAARAALSANPLKSLEHGARQHPGAVRAHGDAVQPKTRSTAVRAPAPPSTNVIALPLILLLGCDAE